MTPTPFAPEEEAKLRALDRKFAMPVSLEARWFATLDAERAKVVAMTGVLNRIVNLIVTEGDPLSGDDQQLVADIRAALTTKGPSQ